VYLDGAINLIALVLSSPLKIRKFKEEKLRLLLSVVTQKNEQQIILKVLKLAAVLKC
jgi:hypothetical protein